MSLLKYLNPNSIKDGSIEGIKIKDSSIEGIKIKDDSIDGTKIKDGAISASKIDETIASKTYVDDTIAAAITASDAMVFKGTLGTGGTTESIPSTAIVGDTYKVTSLSTIPTEYSYTGAEETAKAGDLVIAISDDPKWVVAPSVADYISAIMQSITWSDLKSKRDEGGLIPGMQYRITDYQCTTTQAGTKSAGNVFDIIVTADSKSVLNETARAINHTVAEGETDYFVNNNLSAWKIWYCLDNDTTRFDWADVENGKGVIYRMIDEFNNDVPYDFKNIQFYRQWDSNKWLWSTISSDETGVPCYTFSSSGNGSTTSFTDMSLDVSKNVYSNVIKEYIYVYRDYTNYSIKRHLNNICFFGMICYSNTFGNNCYNITFGNYCSSNSFGTECYNNSFSYNCSSNTFGSGCYDNSFGNNCRSNTVGDNFYLGKIGNEFCSNTFGNDCSNNTFGNYFRNNIIGDDFNNNNISGNYCERNCFGKQCSFITFGDDCKENTFGPNCGAIIFGSDYYYNTVGPHCVQIYFRTDASGKTKANYFKRNKFDPNVSYCTITNSETSSSTTSVQNYHIKSSVSGSSTSNTRVIETTRGLAYDSTVALNSVGELKIYCEADSIK